jgi:ABC-2 type transport system permease protein
LVLGLDYLATLPATLLLSVLTILCISALGLLIGVVSKSEEETVVYAMLCMFVLSGLGGLWMPLDVTGKAFQTLGHLTPLAWAMDGYKAILNSGAGLSEIANSLLVLGAYTLGLLGITIGVYAQQKAKAR